MLPARIFFCFRYCLVSMRNVKKILDCCSKPCVVHVLCLLPLFALSSYLLNWNGQRTRVFRSTRLSRLKIRGHPYSPLRLWMLDHALKTVKTLPYNLSPKESNPWLTCPERIHTLLEKGKNQDSVPRHEWRRSAHPNNGFVWRTGKMEGTKSENQVGKPRLCFEDYLKTTLIKELWNSYLALKRVFWCRAGQQRSHVSWRASQSPVKSK